MREVDLLFVLVPFVLREVDDPAEFEAAFIDQFEFPPDLIACKAGKLVEFIRVASCEEAGVAVLQADLRLNCSRAVRADVVCDRTFTYGL